MALKVQERSAEVSVLAEAWPIAEALLGGTAAMRKAGPTFLPKWPNEEKESYDSRLATATLFPALARTVSVMSGKPFSKQMTLGDDVPANIVEMCDDIDQQGNNLHSFGASLMDEVLGFGLAGVLVDHPTVGGDVKTLHDERALGVRPYMVFIRHGQILGWQSKRQRGVTMLTQLRIAETKEVKDGEFGVKQEPRVRVLEPGTWRVFKPGAKPEDDWVLEDEGVTTLQEIPFVPFYGKRRAFMDGVSPLLDLAYLNVKHWQSQSDQDTIMHVARVPILAVIGADDETKITVGASSAVKIPLGGEMLFVEHTGKAIEAGEKSLEKLEAQMVQTGAELLVEKPGEQKSATQANNDAEGNKSDLQRIVEGFEDSLDQCLQFMAKWLKVPEGGHVSLFKDFGAATLTDASAQLILSLRELGVIDSELLLNELKRRDVIAPDTDIKAAISAGKTEGPIVTATKAVSEPSA